VDADAVQQILDGIFDDALVYHGFTSYMRDYELVVYCTADPRTGIAPTHRRLLFEKCMQATVTTSVSEEIWSRSVDDRLIDYDAGVDLDGYVWGVCWQELYPGGTVVSPSDTAERWSQALSETFHEVRIEANAHTISLVFADVVATMIEPGYSPFTTPDDGPDVTVPLP
jgi:hypothetical protein